MAERSRLDPCEGLGPTAERLREAANRHSSARGRRAASVPMRFRHFSFVFIQLEKAHSLLVLLERT